MRDWSIGKPWNADFGKDFYCIIEKMKAKNFSEFIILSADFLLQKYTPIMVLTSA